MRKRRAISLAALAAMIAVTPAAGWTAPVILAPSQGGKPPVALQGTGSGSHGGFAWRVGAQIYAATLAKTGVRTGTVSPVGAPFDFALAGTQNALLVGVPGANRLDVFRSADGKSWSRRRSGLAFNPIDPLLAATGRNRAVVAVGGTAGLFASAVDASGAVASLQPVLSARSWGALGAQLFGNRVVAAVATPAGVSATVALDGHSFGQEEKALALGVGEGYVNGLAAAVRSTGEAALLVTIRDSGTSGQITALRRSAGGAWSGPDSVSDTARPVLSGPPSVTARLSGGNLVAAWREGTRRKIRIVAAVEVLSHQGQWRTPVFLSAPARTVGRPALATAPDGRVVLAYAVNGQVFARRLSGLTGAYRWSAATRISQAGRSCSSPAIAFRPNGQTAVAFLCGNTGYITTE